MHESVLSFRMATLDGHDIHARKPGLKVSRRLRSHRPLRRVGVCAWDRHRDHPRPHGISEAVQAN